VRLRPQEVLCIRARDAGRYKMRMCEPGHGGRVHRPHTLGDTAADHVASPSWPSGKHDVERLPKRNATITLTIALLHGMETDTCIFGDGPIRY